MIFDYISLKYFIISLAVGFLFVYAIGVKKRMIYVYPSPENVDKVLFKDKANNCFEFEPVEVDCPNDTSLISKVPIQ